MAALGLSCGTRDLHCIMWNLLLLCMDSLSSCSMWAQKLQFMGLAALQCVGSYFPVCKHAKLLQSCPPLCDPMDCNLPGSSVHGILQARILEWVACPPPGHLPNPGIALASPLSPELQADSLLLSHQGSLVILYAI